MGEPIRLVPHLEVELQFLPSTAGGRRKPVLSTMPYRPQLFYRSLDWDGQCTFIDQDQVNPGDTVRAYITFLSPELHTGHIQVGMPFLLREGAQTVAFGRVLEILHLDASAQRSRAGGGHLGYSEAAT